MTDVRLVDLTAMAHLLLLHLQRVVIGQLLAKTASIGAEHSFMEFSYFVEPVADVDVPHIGNTGLTMPDRESDKSVNDLGEKNRVGDGKEKQSEREID